VQWESALCFYYITDRSAFPGNELERRLRLLHKMTEAAKPGSITSNSVKKIFLREN
jgi:hypothetical protein